MVVEGDHISKYKPPKTGVYVQCEYCGKTVYKTLSQYNKRTHHFCSNKCQSLQKHDETYEDRPCEVCGVQMHVSKISKQRFCSDECQHEWQRMIVGEQHPKYAHIPFVCDMCGREYLDTPYKLHTSKYHFCSIQCRREWYATIWSQSDEWKEESRLRAVKLLQSNPVTGTKPQVAVNSMLDSMGIRYENEYPFGHYAIDNYLNDYNLAIEVMGDYWHCNRNKYDSISYKVQREAIRRDIAKHTYMKRYHKINILYLWETDINQMPELIKALIDLYIRKNGMLENCHSFNYHLCDGVPVINTKIVIPYQDIDIQDREKYYTKAAS